MNLKQAFSVAASAGLPALALCAYMYVAPTTVAASSCPEGQIYDPAPPPAPPGQYCASGMGGAVPIGSDGGFPLICHGVGEGECLTGQCVKCLD